MSKLTCKSTVTTEVDPYEAGYAIGVELKPIAPELVTLFPSVHYSDFGDLVSGLLDALEDESVLVFGGTGDGYYEASDIGNHGVSAMGIAGNGTIRCSVALEEGVQSDSFGAAARCAQRVVDELGAAPQIALVFSDGMVGDGVQVIEGVRSVIETPFIGGTTGDDRKLQRGFVIVNRAAKRNAVGILGLSGDFSFSMNVASGWVPIGEAAHVEDADGPVVRQIGGMRAVDFIEKQLGRLPTDAELGMFPLAVYDESGQFFLRATMRGDTVSGEALLCGSVEKGAIVRVSKASVDEILGGVDLALDGLRGVEFPPEAALVFSCTARKWILGAKTTEETERLYQQLGRRVPLAGVPVYGEYRPFRRADGSYSRTFFHNETYVVLLLG